MARLRGAYGRGLARHRVKDAASRQLSDVRARHERRKRRERAYKPPHTHCWLVLVGSAHSARWLFQTASHNFFFFFFFFFSDFDSPLHRFNTVQR